jgi:hypothetical protein
LLDATVVIVSAADECEQTRQAVQQPSHGSIRMDQYARLNKTNMIA